MTLLYVVGLDIPKIYLTVKMYVPFKI